MEYPAKKLSLSFQWIFLWITIIPMSFTSKDLSKNDNSEMFFEGQSFLQYNLTEMSNSEALGTDCQTDIQLWFKPTNRQGILIVFSSDSCTWTGIGLQDGYLRTFVFNQTNQSQSVIYGEAITKVTMKKWLDLVIRIRNTKISYSGKGQNNFTGTLNHVTRSANIYVGGVPVLWKSKGENFQNFTGFIKEFFVVCKNDSDSAAVSSAVKSASFRCLGTCNFSRTRTTNRGKITPQPSLSASRKSPPTAYTTDIVLKKRNRINAASTTQRSGFLNNSIEGNKIDIVMTNSERSPSQSTAKVSGIAKVYQVTVILVIVLFAAVSLYVLGMIVKNKVQQYRAKHREEQQLTFDTGSNQCLAGRGAEDRNSLTSNLCDIETVTNIDEQKTNRFWRERGNRLKVHQGNQLRLSASTQSLMSNLNVMESVNQVKKGNPVRMSESTHSLKFQRRSAPVCESSLFVTPRPIRKRQGTSSSKDIPHVVLTSACARDDKIIIKRVNQIKSIHGRAINTLININGKIPVKGMEELCNEEGGHKGEGKYKSFKNADKMAGFALNPKENSGNMSYKWAYIRPDSETECSENEKMRQSSKTKRFFDTSFRPCSLRILETNESEEEDETYDNKDKNCDEFQTFKCRSRDNICRGGEMMKISYNPCLSSSRSERLVCFGIHSASSDPSVVSSSGGNLMCDCSIQQRLHSSYHDTASEPELESHHLDAFLDSSLYNKSCPVDLKNENCTSYVQENDGLHSRQPKLDNDQSFLKTNKTYIKLLTDSKDLHVPKIPSPPPPPQLPPSSLQLQQKKRQQLQLDQLPSFLISKEMQNNQEKNINGQRGRLLRQPKVDLPNPRPHSICNFTRRDDVDEDLYHPIRMTHASSCESIPQWVITPSSSINSNESVKESACARQNIFSSQQGVNQAKTQECEKPISRDVHVTDSNDLDNSAQQAKVSNQQVARETKNQTLKKLMPDSSRGDVPVASSVNGFKNPWILRPNVLSKKNEHGIQRKPVLQTKYQVSRWNPRQGMKPKSSLTVNNKDGEGEGKKKVLRRSSWASGNRPSEFELALKGTVPVKRPPSNASVLLKVPGSKTRPKSETMF